MTAWITWNWAIGLTFDLIIINVVEHAAVWIELARYASMDVNCAC